MSPNVLFESYEPNARRNRVQRGGDADVAPRLFFSKKQTLSRHYPHQENLSLLSLSPSLPPPTPADRLLLSDGYSGDRSRAVPGNSRPAQRQPRGALRPARCLARRAVPRGEPTAEGDRSPSGEGSEVLRRRQRSLHRYDGEVLRAAGRVQATPGEAQSTLSGLFY